LVIDLERARVVQLAREIAAAYERDGRGLVIVNARRVRRAGPLGVGVIATFD
jgi:hypothetical protein